MNPKIHYLIELTKLVGRLGYALESNDTHAFLGILQLIKNLTETSMKAHTPKPPFRVVDPEWYNIDDDDL